MSVSIPKPGKIFFPGLMIQQAALRYPAAAMRLDRPLDLAPELGTTCTYTDFAGLVERTAARLAAGGVAPGDTVVVYKSHNADIMLVACAVARVGAVPALLAPPLDGRTVTDLLDRIRPAHLVTDSAKLLDGDLDLSIVEKLVPSLLLVGPAPAGLTSLGDLDGAPPPLPQTSADQTAIITHTSGTTGEPKLVAQSRRGMQAHITLQRRIARILRIDEPYALCISFVHARMYSALAMGMERGLPFAFLTDHSLDSVRTLFAEFRPGLVETHPNTYILWEELADDPNGPLANVKYYVGTFDAIHPRTVRTLLGASQRRGALYFQAYGQTETGPVTVRPYTRWLAKRADGRCVGHPVPGLTRVRIGAGRRAGRRQAPIEVRSKGLGITYLGQEERFAAQFDDGWWNMQDIGHRGRWGCVHLLDRAIDRIPEMDSVLTVEDTVLSRDHQLTELVVVPLPGGLQPVVCTRHDRPLDRGAWAAAVRDQPAMAEPLHCRWADLPQTATWKVKRTELRRVLQEGGLTTLGTAPE
jgi:acyl-coenzyme A synthetase/AMP-(fatty) acid ligase